MCHAKLRDQNISYIGKRYGMNKKKRVGIAHTRINRDD